VPASDASPANEKRIRLAARLSESELCVPDESDESPGHSAQKKLRDLMSEGFSRSEMLRKGATFGRMMIQQAWVPSRREKRPSRQERIKRTPKRTSDCELQHPGNRGDVKPAVQTPSRRISLLRLQFH